ncbi:MAG: ABC transporter substrate-binding protein [Halanaerobiales bacterium]
MKKILFIIAILIFLTLLFTGCNSQQESQDLSLKVGLMPAVDGAPVLLADEKGYYEELGLELDIQIYRNANNRQSALQSGELDGTMTDLIAFVNNIQNGFDIKITTSTDGSFPFLIKQDFEEKEEIKIGMMRVSVSNFLSDQFLGSKYKMEKLYIPAIPSRLEMIVAGQMDMAIIPEPMASMGQLRGLEKRVYENEDNFMPEAMVFTDTALNKKSEAISLFHQAYNKAVRDIQKDDNEARDVLIKRLELNPEIKDMIVMPQYHLARVPDQNYMNKVVDWIEEVQDIEINVKYSDMITREFLE